MSTDPTDRGGSTFNTTISFWQTIISNHLLGTVIHQVLLLLYKFLSGHISSLVCNIIARNTAKELTNMKNANSHTFLVNSLALLSCYRRKLNWHDYLLFLNASCLCHMFLLSPWGLHFLQEFVQNVEDSRQEIIDLSSLYPTLFIFSRFPASQRVASCTEIASITFFSLTTQRMHVIRIQPNK